MRNLTERSQSDFPISRSGIGATLRHFTEVDSTNRVARSWVGEGGVGSSFTGGLVGGGLLDGGVVLADSQTMGRGRQGRSWQSSPGQNLLLSVVVQIREPLLSNHVARGMLPLATALAVAEAISHFVTPESVKIKWPNDVRIDCLKCAGILVETVADEAFIIGMGLNVNEDSFSDELAETATSLLLQTGQRQDRTAVYAELMRSLNGWIPRVFDRDHAEILAEYGARLDGMNQPITLNTPSEVVHGMLVGIHDDGGLVVEHAKNGDRPEDTSSVRKVYYAGDVSLTHRLD